MSPRTKVESRAKSEPPDSTLLLYAIARPIEVSSSA